MSQNNPQNNISNNIMEEIKTLMSQDEKSPKNIKLKGKFTKAFEKWNQKAIREGKTSVYLPGDKLLKYYKNGNSRFIKIKYDKSYKNKKVVSKLFKKEHPTYEDLNGSV